MVLAGLQAIVRSDRDLEVAGSVSDLSEAHINADAVGADVIVAAKSASGDGELMSRLQSVLPPSSAPLILLSDDRHAVARTTPLPGNVRAILPRDASAHEIIAAIGAVAAGLIVFAHDSWGAPAGPAVDYQRHGAPRDGTLTARELQVLQMLAAGMDNKSIGAKLSISAHTVKFHVTSILGKLDAGSRTEAVAIGIRRGLILL